MAFAAALEGIQRDFAPRRDNGVIDIGLQAALDTGLSESSFVRIPRCALKEVTLTNAGEEGEAVVVPAVTNSRAAI